MKIQMIDAMYLRRQAQLCFAIADLMSNPADAKLARLAAETYEQRAEKADREQNVPASNRVRSFRDARYFLQVGPSKT
jgi:hypothetical protein